MKALLVVADPIPVDVALYLLAVDGRLAGLLAVSDPIKPTSQQAVAQLQNADVKVIMATGDGLTTARAVAKQLGIEEVHGEVKPQDKEKLVAELQSYGRRVAMAGDGQVTVGQQVMKNQASKIRRLYKDQVLAGFAGAAADALALFEKFVKEFGLRGYKIYPGTGFYPFDEALKPFFKKCVDWEIPVLTHTSGNSFPHMGRFSDPTLLQEVVVEFV